ncbi:MAG: 6-carboxytetrahydropterin synthase [Phycisphaerales bacterium]|nr:6-carboxytetrahydropterin synthase [Phycisphaerales bacterium]
MYTVTVEAGFCAAHQVRLADGSLEPLHGHDWVVTVVCRARQLDALDMVVDFERVRAALEDTLRPLHHANLNNVSMLTGRNPTAEVVAERILASLHLKGLSSVAQVTVTEAPGCAATFENDLSTQETGADGTP